MNKIKSIFSISRPVNLSITFIVVIISAMICSNTLDVTFTIFFGALSALLVAAAGNIINDYFDIETDKINRPNRPIPSGKISEKEALQLYLAFNLIAIIIAGLISLMALATVIITISLLFLYSYRLKGTALVGNIVIALCTSLAFVFGGVIVGNTAASFIPALFAFQITLIREILKDVEDLEGDVKSNQITFAGKYGSVKSIQLIKILIILLILTTFYPFVIHLYSVIYFIIVIVLVDLPLLYILKILNVGAIPSNIKQVSLFLKLLMISGLFAIFIGIVWIV